MISWTFVELIWFCLMKCTSLFAFAITSLKFSQNTFSDGACQNQFVIQVTHVSHFGLKSIISIDRLDQENSYAEQTPRHLQIFPSVWSYILSIKKLYSLSSPELLSRWSTLNLLGSKNFFTPTPVIEPGSPTYKTRILTAERKYQK